MQFIDHHGLDLLVDSIEEFAAREESSPLTADLPVNGLQLLSALAEQRSLEERSSTDSSALRRHSADSHTTNGFSNDIPKQTNAEYNALKRRQRSESCFTSNPMKFNENEECLSDLKKQMRTSGSQTDSRRVNGLDNIRRSERIFINDSVVSNGKEDKSDVIKDKDLLLNKEFKRRDSFGSKSKVAFSDMKAMSDKMSNSEQSPEVRPKDLYVFTGTKCDDFVPNLTKFSIIRNKTKTNDSLVFCDKQNNNLKIGSNLATDSTADKAVGQQSPEIKKKKKKKLFSSCGTSIGSSFDGNSGEKRVKKRKKRPTEEDSSKKKLKTDYDKQIDDSIETIIKRMAQIDEPIDESSAEHKSTEKVIKEKKIISEEVVKTNENKSSDEQKDINKKKRPLVKTQSFELYDQKRMKLLDQTIDAVIAKQSAQNKTEQQITESSDQMTPKVEQKTELITESKPISDETPVVTSPPEAVPELPPKETVTIETEPKPKPLVKQSSTCSSVSLSSSTSSLSESCLSSTPSLNLKLTESDLDLKLNVIMLVDGLLFVGEICPIQAPDIYGIILHGERQHRPIIYSQEEMLKEAIREVCIHLLIIYSNKWL